MKRLEFLRKSLLGSIGLGIAAKPVLEAKAASDNSLDLQKQVGFNHIKTMETKTLTSVLHKADTRGDANHGWLHSRHSFSFANYYNPERMGFGTLRVLNDDEVAPAMGFGKHPHDNMEIISIPLEGDLEHKDSMGTKAVIKEGDIQVMSAGTGIFHSEYNANKEKEVKFLQIWIFPNKRSVKPRYDQIAIKDLEVKNKFSQILSPNQHDQGVWIHQNAWFNIGNFETGAGDTYTLNDTKNGVYAFVLEGNVTINGQELNRRDGYGLWDLEKVELKALTKARVLLMEVPMSETEF